MRFADLDAVTIDAFGTLVELIDPVPALQPALAERGVGGSTGEIREALRVEVRYYREHVGEAVDDATLRELRVRCTGVFVEALGVALDAADFMPAFVGALRFRTLAHVEPALELLRSRGLPLAVVANWDIGLREHLARLGLSRFFAAVEPAASKPSPDGLLRALHALGVPPARALHVGDEGGDEEAARSAGTGFLPAPLSTAVGALA